jgi:pyridinium-3,5-bisthiocarboxylic acid mononucleotide nickel chelatase
MKSSKNPKWEIPIDKYHAHFDCFSGAAGDMMLAACLDAAGSKQDEMIRYIQFCLEQGLPDLKGEFSISTKRVRKSKMGSIAANYLLVHSKYNHTPAPVPKPAQDGTTDNSIIDPHVIVGNHHHDHSHHHHHDHHHHHKHEQQNKAQTASEGSKPLIDNDESGLSDTNSHSLSKSHNHATSINGPLRNLPEIRFMLEKASTQYIPQWVKTMSIAAFTELAQAEAMTHGASSPDDVHFHEVGAIDSIVDTVGTCLALHLLGVTSVSCSRLPIGEGTVWTEHGLLPVPTPATLYLMIGMPICPGPPGRTGELVTPTAAALLKVLTRFPNQTSSNGHGDIMDRPPRMTIRHIGIGAGTKDFVKHPNILRLILGNNVNE